MSGLEPRYFFQYVIHALKLTRGTRDTVSTPGKFPNGEENTKYVLCWQPKMATSTTLGPSRHWEVTAAALCLEHLAAGSLFSLTIL